MAQRVTYRPAWPDAHLAAEGQKRSWRPAHPL